MCARTPPGIHSHTRDCRYDCDIPMLEGTNAACLPPVIVHTLRGVKRAAIFTQGTDGSLWNTFVAAFDSHFRLVLWSPLDTRAKDARLTHSVLSRALNLNEAEHCPVCSRDEASNRSSTGRPAAAGGYQKIATRGNPRFRQVSE
jgi:hypothetical protein